MNDTMVYVLGAGCSVKYGYPLANDFLVHSNHLATTSAASVKNN
jgi:hypothetical protein